MAHMQRKKGDGSCDALGGAWQQIHTAARPCCGSKDLAFQFLQPYICEMRADQVGIFWCHWPHRAHRCARRCGSVLFPFGILGFIWSILPLVWPRDGFVSHFAAPAAARPRETNTAQRCLKACYWVGAHNFRAQGKEKDIVKQWNATKPTRTHLRMPCAFKFFANIYHIGFRLSLIWKFYLMFPPFFHSRILQELLAREWGAFVPSSFAIIWANINLSLPIRYWYLRRRTWMVCPLTWMREGKEGEREVRWESREEKSTNEIQEGYMCNSIADIQLASHALISMVRTRNNYKT
jgi:hypothetical protein